MALCATGALVLVAGSLLAQAPSPDPGPGLTLAQARALAQRTSPDLAAARQAVAAARGRERQAGAVPNPTLSYAREQAGRGGATASQDIVALDQRLEIGGQRGARREAARLQREAAEARLAAAEGRVSYEVARSYAAAVATTRRALHADEAAEAFAAAERISESRLAGGDVSGYQHRRLRLEAARYRALHLEAALARDSAMRVLAVLMGGPDSLQAPTFRLADTLLPAPLTVSAEALVERALVERDELRGARLEADAGLAEARLATRERLPTPALSAGFKRERLTSGEDFHGFVAGVSVPLPVWDRRGGAVAAAHADAGRRAAEAEALRQQTVREVRTAYDAHETLAGELAVLAGHLGEEAVKARRSAEVAYREGEISLLEWLDAVRAYHDAEIAYVTLWAEYIARRAALERATGATLF